MVAEGIGMKELQLEFGGFELDDPYHWHMSFDVAACVFCAWISSKVKVYCSLSVNLKVHMFDHGIRWLLSFNCKAVISLRDAITGPS